MALLNDILKKLKKVFKKKKTRRKKSTKRRGKRTARSKVPAKRTSKKKSPPKLSRKAKKSTKPKAKKSAVKKKLVKKKKVVKKKVVKKKVVNKKVVKKKVIKKKAVKKNAVKKGNLLKKGKSKEDSPGILIGEITHYFSKIGVVVVKMTHGSLRIGDEIIIKGRETHFSQKVRSLQIESLDVKSAKKGQLVGLKSVKKAKVGDMVFKK